MCRVAGELLIRVYQKGLWIPSGWYGRDSAAISEPGDFGGLTTFLRNFVPRPFRALREERRFLRRPHSAFSNTRKEENEELP